MKLFSVFTQLGLKTHDFDIGLAQAENKARCFGEVMSRIFSDATIETSKRLLASIEGLYTIKNRSVEQKQRLLEYIHMLNDSMGETVLLYNEKTEAINQSIEAIKSQIEAKEASLQPLTKKYANMGDTASNALKTIVEFLATLGNAISKVAGLIALGGLGKVVEYLRLIGGKLKGLKLVLGPKGWLLLALAAFGGTLINLYQTNEEFHDKVTGTWENLKERSKEIWGDIQDTLKLVWELLGPFVQYTLDKIITFLDFAFNHIANKVQFVLSSIHNVLDFFLGIISGDWERAWSAIVNQFEATGEFIGNTVKAIRNLIVGQMENVTTFLRNLSLFEVGQNIIDSLVKGITGAIDAVISIASNIADAITSPIRNALGINSPSRVFLEIGKNVCEGFVDGVYSMQGTIKKAMDDTFGNLDQNMSVSLGGGLGNALMSGGNNGTIEQTLEEKESLFKNVYSNIADIVSSQFTNMMNKAKDIIRHMMSQVDSFLRIEGFNVGRNFFKALGDGLIAEEAALLTRAQWVADAIRAAFAAPGPNPMARAAQAAVNAAHAVMTFQNAGSFAGGLNHAPLHSSHTSMHLEEIALSVQKAAEHKAQGSSGDTIIQHFHGVTEKETGYAAYRGFQKAQLALGRT